MKSAKAFAPGNISCVFKIYSHKSPRWMGSYGFGFTVNEGVIAEASKSKKTEIFFNDKPINFPTVRSTIKKLTRENVKIFLKSKLPLGCGFGLSGASALAASYSINELLNLKKSNKELAIIAHTAEVENKTGLGDVVNQFFGGFCLKFRPSSHFIVKKLPLDDINVYCRYFSKIDTKSIITNTSIKNKINKSAATALKKIKELTKKNKKFKLREVIKISKEFSEKSGLLKEKNTIKLVNIIEKNNGNSSMIMLGNAVFSDIPFKNSIKLKITDKKAHLFN